MKRLIFCGLLCCQLYAMEDVDLEQGLQHVPGRPHSAEIASKIAEVIVQFGDELTADDQRFKSLVVHYFKKESIEIESSIMPHLKKRLRDSDSEINKILEEDDKARLTDFIDRLISESIEDAFKEKEHQYEELKELAEGKERKAKYALGTAIVSGIAGVLTVFFSVFFGKS